ncbi:MAG: hypothetical protein JWQ38_3444 [Flavipsychrobacter sp.]|nr:hypothetical protein [Flavipsychrobacter sp.]
MKKLLIVLLICLAGTFTACKKESAYKFSGSIEGVDNSSCGGYIIKIDGKNKYRCTTFPAGSNVTTASHFPIQINLNYTEAGKCLANQYIVISSMIITY